MFDLEHRGYSLVLTDWILFSRFDLVFETHFDFGFRAAPLLVVELGGCGLHGLGDNAP